MLKTIKLESKDLPYLVNKIINEMSYNGFSHIQINDKIKNDLMVIKSGLETFEQAIPDGDFDSLFFKMENIQSASESILKELRHIREVNY